MGLRESTSWLPVAEMKLAVDVVSIPRRSLCSEPKLAIEVMSVVIQRTKLSGENVGSVHVKKSSASDPVKPT